MVKAILYYISTLKVKFNTFYLVSFKSIYYFLKKFEGFESWCATYYKFKEVNDGFIMILKILLFYIYRKNKGRDDIFAYFFMFSPKTNKA